MMRFDRFTERAQEAAARAAELAQKYGHTQVDVEHVLLALLEQTDGVVLQILEHIGGNVDALRHRVEEVLRTGPKTSIYGSGGTGQVFVTPRLKRVLDLAIEEASKLKDEYISTEHILLAMAADRSSRSAQTGPMRWKPVAHQFQKGVSVFDRAFLLELSDLNLIIRHACHWRRIRAWQRHRDPPGPTPRRGVLNRGIAGL
jgi:ATP-dependent Clp protease ATP-binding subunit ClpA